MTCLRLVVLLGLVVSVAPTSVVAGDIATSAPRAGRPTPACSLSPEQIQARRSELLPGFLDRAESVTEIRRGVRLRFVNEPGLVSELAGLIENERGCCAFLEFRLVTKGDGPIVLDVTGPRGSRELLRKLRAS